MQWLPLSLFALVAIAWLAFRLIIVKDSRRKSTQFLLNAKQKYLSLVSLTLLILSLLIVPWRVDAQLLAFPTFSHISYGWVWHPPSGGINQSLVGIATAQEGILFGWVLAEWLVLSFLYCCFLLVFKDSKANELKHDA
jgi:hypothetical protein